MKTFSPARYFRLACISLATIVIAGCASPNESTSPTAGKACPANLSFHYVDSTQGFSLCLPAGVTKGDAGAYPTGSVLFNGFAVPKGTNLVTKKLIIVPGTDPDTQAQTADGSFTAGGVTFTRTRSMDGSAGHQTQFIIYTWTRGGKTLHFDFSLFSVNVNNFPTSSQPKEFDLAAQVKFTEDVMRTFQRVH